MTCLQHIFSRCNEITVGEFGMVKLRLAVCFSFFPFGKPILKGCSKWFRHIVLIKVFVFWSVGRKGGRGRERERSSPFHNLFRLLLGHGSRY